MERQEQQEAAAKPHEGGFRRALGLWLAALALVIIVVSLRALGVPETVSFLPLVVGVLIAVMACLLMGLSRSRHEALPRRLAASLESLKDLQWEVRDRETRYRDLLDHQGDVILRRDPEFRLTFANDAFWGTFGLERETALGQTFILPVSSGAGEQAPSAEDGQRQSQIVELATSHGPRWFVWELFIII